MTAALGIGALAAVLCLWAAAVILALRWAGQRRDEGDQAAAQAPAPAHPRVPEPHPGPGAAAPVVPPGPGPACTITIKFYDDGSSKIYDHTRRRRFHIHPPPDIDLSDEALADALEEFLRGQG